MLPILFGFSGLELTAEEREFFRAFPPLGYHLFRRNIDTPDQVKTLVRSLNDLHGTQNLPIFIDMEGGRVQRLRPPHWVDLPSMGDIGDLYTVNASKGERAVKLHTQTIAAMLLELGLTGNYAPVLDVPVPGAHDVIGRRAFSEEPALVTQLCTLMTREYLESGIMPTLKHLPGHGRAEADSHFECPVVKLDHDTLEKTDFYPFKNVAAAIGAENVWSMTAHVVFTALDDQPVSVSKKAIDFLRSELGIVGPIVPDAIEMDALGGTLAERALATLNAGCDAVLHCSGKLDDMKDIAKVLPEITPQAQKRFKIAENNRRKHKTEVNWRETFAELQDLLDIRSADTHKTHEAFVA